MSFFVVNQKEFVQKKNPANWKKVRIYGKGHSVHYGKWKDPILTDMTSIVGVPTGRLTDTECYNRKGGVSCGGGGVREREGWPDCQRIQ